jgi:hypothetical protein
LFINKPKIIKNKRKGKGKKKSCFLFFDNNFVVGYWDVEWHRSYSDGSWKFKLEQ